MNTRRLFSIINNTENYISQLLLVFFVILLFIQVLLRVFFSYAITWGEELSRFAFVWFVYFGAAYATSMDAHNRITVQLRIFPQKVQTAILIFSDMGWIAFNSAMIYYSVQVIRSMGEFKYFSPTLDWSMEYVFYIFPIAFLLINIRIIQVLYLKHIKGVIFNDPE